MERRGGVEEAEEETNQKEPRKMRKKKIERSSCYKRSHEEIETPSLNLCCGLRCVFLDVYICLCVPTHTPPAILWAEVLRHCWNKS